jgi:hypothetical protein
MQVRILDAAGIVQMDGDPGVALDTGYRLNGYFLSHTYLLISASAIARPSVQVEVIPSYSEPGGS